MSYTSFQKILGVMLIHVGYVNTKSSHVNTKQPPKDRTKTVCKLDFKLIFKRRIKLDFMKLAIQLCEFAGVNEFLSAAESCCRNK